MMGFFNVDNNGIFLGVVVRRGIRGNLRLMLGIDDEERLIFDVFREEVDYIGLEVRIEFLVF